jgi:hypothetical protein
MTATRSVRLVNTGNAPTHITGFTSSRPAFSLSAALPLEVPAFSYVYVPAAFAPASLGRDSAIVEPQSDAQESAVPRISLRGEGIVAPIVSVSPQGFDVQMTEGGRTEQLLNIRNPGGDSLKLTLRATVEAGGGHPATGPEKVNVLYINTAFHTYDNPSDFFMWNLKTDPRIGELTSYLGEDSTPSLEYMRQFDVILVSAYNPWADPAALGDRLADYVDGGGKLCIMHAALYASNIGLGGRIISPEYSPVAPAGGYGGQYLTDPADHPIMEGITSDLYSDWIMDVSETQGGGVPLGYYNLGRLVGAYHPRKPVVFLNVFPVGGYSNVFQTVRLIGNSFQFLSEYYNWMQPAQRTLALGPGDEIGVPIRFGSPFSPAAGNYSGSLNLFHNDPATGSPLVVPAKLTVTPAGETAAMPVP